MDLSENIDNSVYFNPEAKLFHMLNTCILEFREELTNNTDFIDKLFGNIKIGKEYVYKEQIKKILSENKNSQRFFEIFFAFNQGVTKFPSAFLTLASDNQKPYSLGNGEEDDKIEYVDDYRNIYTNRFTTSQNLFIYSDNSNEVTLLYHFFKALIMSLKDVFSVMGFENLMVGGQDIVQTSDIVPGAKAYRVLSIRYEYETSSMSLNKELFIKIINFNDKIIQ